MIVLLLFLFHMTHWSRILANRRLLSNHFCKACQNCLHLSFVIVHKAVRLHLLLLCCESSRKCYHAAQTTPTWTKPSWHVLQKLLLCSHPWPNMNELCTKLKFTNYTIMRWNQFCYLFSILRNFESNPGFLLRNSIELILKTWKKSNLDMSYNPCYHSLLLVLWSVFLFFRDLKLNLGFLFCDSHSLEKFFIFTIYQNYTLALTKW